MVGAIGSERCDDQSAVGREGGVECGTVAGLVDRLGQEMEDRAIVPDIDCRRGVQLRRLACTQ